jgi:hypothetical protein
MPDEVEGEVPGGPLPDPAMRTCFETAVMQDLEAGLTSFDETTTLHRISGSDGESYWLSPE